VFKILKECSGRKPFLIIFCSTVYKDKDWIQVRKYFEKKGMEIRVCTSIYEDVKNQQILSKVSKGKQRKKKKKKQGRTVMRKLMTLIDVMIFYLD
jgi:hypothetical protein